MNEHRHCERCHKAPAETRVDLGCNLFLPLCNLCAARLREKLWLQTMEDEGTKK